MEMSTVEISARANFLIYYHIKKKLNSNDLAERFRKVIQETSQKDMIIFEGLESLTEVLKNYYSLQVTTADKPSAAVADSENISPANAIAEETGTGASGDGKTEKRKKKKQQRHSRPVAEESPEQPADVEAEPAPGEAAEEQQPPEADTSRTERKKKKKRRHTETEETGLIAVAAGIDVGDAEKLAETPAPKEPSAAPPATAAEEGEEPRKKRKKHKVEAGETSTNGDHTVEVKAELQSEDTPLSFKTAEAGGESSETNASGGKKQQKRHNQPFRRVREEEVVNKHFHDNSFDAKANASTGWGYKANEDLKPTQGRSFRHEKTKKKRGSYKGGTIDTGVCSMKFDSDSE